jgi:hypothetical protein
MEDKAMKRLLLVIALIVASVQLQASHPESELNLKMFDRSWFTVTIDHMDFPTPVTHIELDDLEPGSHYLRVTRIDFNPWGFNPHALVVFSGYIHLAANARTHALIDKHFRFRVTRITPFAPQPVVFVPAPVMFPAPVYYGMSEYEFSNLYRTINNLSFESSRMQVARQAIAANQFTSRQVMDLMRLMTFESSKLEIAKRAYQKTVDKQNYYMVNDIFTFESSIRDLNQYLGLG